MNSIETDSGTRALRGVEQLDEKMQALVSARTRAAVFDGSGTANGTSFGNFVVRSTAAAVVSFTGSAAELTFCGKKVAGGASPVLAILPRGKGEIKLSAQSGARMLVFGDVAKIS